MFLAVNVRHDQQTELSEKPPCFVKRKQPIAIGNCY